MATQTKGLKVSKRRPREAQPPEAVDAIDPSWHVLPKTSHCPACQRLVTDRAIRTCATRYCPGRRGKL